MIEELKEQWEQTPLWQKIFLLTVFPLAIIATFWFYTLRPINEEKVRLSQEKEKLQQEIDSYKLLLVGKRIEYLQKQLEDLSRKEMEVQQKLMNMVGLLPSYNDFEEVFSLINNIAFKNGVVITAVNVSDPVKTRFELIKTPHGNLVKEIVTEEEQEKQSKREEKIKRKVLKGIPITYVDITVEIRGKTENIYRFLSDIKKRGIVSFPKLITLSPSNEGVVVAEIQIGVVLRGDET